jgi:GST-like protein
MTESAAILIQLGLTHPHSGLLPNDALARAQAVRGLVFNAANCYAAISIVHYPERCTDGAAESVEALRHGSLAQLNRLWTMFADTWMPTTADQPYLGGRQPGDWTCSPLW